MATTFAFNLDEADCEKCRRALEAIPRDQWPSGEMWDRVYLSVRLRSMEAAEMDDEAA